MTFIPSDPLSQAISVVLCGAVTHALFGIALKKGEDKLALRAMTTWFSALYYMPLLLVVPLPSTAGFQTLAISGCVHFLYQFFQIKSLEHIDISISYPLSRGITPFLIAIGSMIFLEEVISLSVMMGICTIVLSVFFLIDYARLKHMPHFTSGILWSFLTGACIATYTLIDSTGARSEANFLSYIAWFFIFDGIGITFLFLIKRRKSIIPSMRQEVRRAWLSGLLGAASFGFVMFAFVLAGEHTTVIAGFRETSIVFGVLFAYILLGEVVSKRRLFSAVGVFLGAVLLRLG